MDIAKMSKAELEYEILSNDSLYAEFDEDRLYARNGKTLYSMREMREIIQKWIEDGDETGH